MRVAEPCAALPPQIWEDHKADYAPRRKRSLQIVE